MAIPDRFSWNVRPAWLIVALCAFALEAGPAQPVQAQDAQPQVPPIESGAGVSNPYGVDLKSLRYEGKETAALARMKGRPFIVARDYNDWLGTYPLNITAVDPAERINQALEQMAMFKLMLSHAKKAGYESRIRTSGGVPDERSIVLMFIRDQITNVSAVSDQMARDYEAAHPERFPQGDQRLPPEILAMAVKGEIRGQQFTEEIKTWMREEEVTFHAGPGKSRSKQNSK